MLLSTLAYLLASSIPFLNAEPLSSANTPNNASLHIITLTPPTRHSAPTLITAVLELIGVFTTSPVEHINEDVVQCWWRSDGNIECMKFTPNIQVRTITKATYSWFLLGWLNEGFKANNDTQSEEWVVRTYELVVDGDVVVGTLETYVAPPAREGAVPATRLDEGLVTEKLGEGGKGSLMVDEWTGEFEGEKIPFRTFVRLAVDFHFRFLWTVPQVGVPLPAFWIDGAVLQTGRDAGTGAVIALSLRELANRILNVGVVTALLSTYFVIDMIGEASRWETYKGTAWSRELQKDFFKFEISVVKDGRGRETLEEEGNLGGFVLPVTNKVGGTLKVGDMNGAF